ncbi:MAG: PfkB family carbohydrate kinase [Salinivirgaceae bacterium]
MFLTLGESVFDIIFSDMEPVAARFGGSMFNVAVSLGRAKCEVQFAGVYANDRIGKQTRAFLQENGVDATCFSPINGVRSNLALAFLDDRGVPDYSFYRHNQPISESTPIDFSRISKFIIGSFYVIDRQNVDCVNALVEHAKNAGAEVFYDPNIRNKRVFSDSALREHVVNFMRAATVTKMSDEDLTAITGFAKLTDWQTFLEQNGVANYIITRGSNTVLAHFSGKEKHFQVPELSSVVSTVGAGDAFMAGLLFALRDNPVTEKAFFDAVPTGIRFGSYVCTTNDNYISNQFMESRAWENNS